MAAGLHHVCIVCSKQRTRHGVEDIQPQLHEPGGNMLPDLCQKVRSDRSRAWAELGSTIRV